MSDHTIVAVVCLSLATLAAIVSVVATVRAVRVYGRAEREVSTRRLRAQLEEIRGLHTDSPAGVCPVCVDLHHAEWPTPYNYPCPTLRAMGIEPRGGPS